MQLQPGVVARRLPTERLTVNVLAREGRDGGEPVLLVHGNISSALFWQQTITALPDRYRPLAVDLRGFGHTDPLPVDATRGVGDYADDLTALLAALDLGRAHLVGWSLGGAVALHLLRERPDVWRSVTLVNPVSPYGWGGTRGAAGEWCTPDAAGSGGGTANPEFVQRLADGDRGDDSPMSPLSVFRGFYVKPGTTLPDEDVYLASMLSTRVGDDSYPGDATTTEAWPSLAPGTRGVLNTIAPPHFRLDDLGSGGSSGPKPPVLWVRGEHDQIVSDTSMLDLGHLGALGAVPGWPGDDTFPAQPMVTQTRAVLDRYADAGGHVREVVLDAGHSPHVETPGDFVDALTSVLGGAS